MLRVWKGVLLSVRSKSLAFTKPMPMTHVSTTVLMMARTTATFTVSFDFMLILRLPLRIVFTCAMDEMLLRLIYRQKQFVHKPGPTCPSRIPGKRREQKPFRSVTMGPGIE